MDIQKMYIVCTIQQIESRIGINKTSFDKLKHKSITALENKRDNLIKTYNNNLAKQ